WHRRLANVQHLPVLGCAVTPAVLLCNLCREAGHGAALRLRGCEAGLYAGRRTGWGMWAGHPGPAARGGGTPGGTEAAENAARAARREPPAPLPGALQG